VGGTWEHDEEYCALIQRFPRFPNGLEEIIAFSAGLIENIEETLNK